MFKRFPWVPSQTDAAAIGLLTAITQAARNPNLYGEGRVPDTLDGRFEAMTLFACLVLQRLSADPKGERRAQAFTDRLFRSFDAGLREAAVGDLTVPKRMKTLAQAFYGRAGAYGRCASAPDWTLALARNVWNAEDAAFAGVLAARVMSLQAAMAAQPIETLAEPALWRHTEDLL
jgi:cytochrome b pre-mRNA-processing protein 3